MYLYDSSYSNVQKNVNNVKFVYYYVNFIPTPSSFHINLKKLRKKILDDTLFCPRKTKIYPYHINIIKYSVTKL